MREKKNSLKSRFSLLAHAYRMVYSRCEKKKEKKNREMSEL
jgi:hypothetical protein